jgi:hypothetical protein
MSRLKMNKHQEVLLCIHNSQAKRVVFSKISLVYDNRNPYIPRIASDTQRDVWHPPNTNNVGHGDILPCGLNNNRNQPCFEASLLADIPSHKITTLDDWIDILI